MVNKHLSGCATRASRCGGLCLALILFLGCSNDERLEAESTIMPSTPDARPNFLLIISDDQSWEHTSFAGYPLVATPHFDRIAREGVYFDHAYAAAPSCTASRSALLAGQAIWRLGSSAMLRSNYSREMVSFQFLLSDVGYTVGYTGKGWGPGKIPAEANLPHAPTGIAFNSIQRTVDNNLGAGDLVANFGAFLDQSDPSRPFSFWLGSIEPHRPYAKVANRFTTAGKRRYIPPFLPPSNKVGEQLSAYLAEIERFDRDVGAVLAMLQSRGLLDNTVVIITSDNGMPFSRAKTQNYTHGVRVPLAIRWGNINRPGRRVTDFVNLADIAPTLLELAGAAIPESMTGRSLSYALHSDRNGRIDTSRDNTVTAYERHSGFIREGEKNLTYPRRALHTEQFLYILNYFPQRWPAGDPPNFVEAYPGLLIDPKRHKPIQPYHARATQKRPAEELYDLREDPAQFNNLADNVEFADTKQKLRDTLTTILREQGDPVEISGKDVFGQYAYIGEWKGLPTDKTTKAK